MLNLIQHLKGDPLSIVSHFFQNDCICIISVILYYKK